jgi:parvulin-like peptidyl-prolyl isomerase
VRASSRRSFPWSNLDSEGRSAVLLIGGISLIVVFAVALIAYGYYTDRVQPKHETIVRVGDTRFDYSYLERRVKSEVSRGTISQQNLAQGIYDTLGLIQREELQRQTAQRMGIEVTEDDILARYRAKLGLPSSTTQEVMAPLIRAELIRLNLSLEELRNIAIAEASNRKIREQITSEVPAQSEHVEIHVIEVDTQAAGLLAKERIDKGEEFAFVAAEVSQDDSGKEHGGDLSWTPREALPKEVGDAAFSIEFDKVSDVIETKQGFYLIKVTGKETRQLTDNGKEAVVERRLEDALFETRDAVGLDVTVSDEQIQRLAISVQPSLG